MAALIDRFWPVVERPAKFLSRKGLYPFLEREFGAIAAGSDVLSVGSGGAVNDRLRHHARARPFTVTSFDIDAGRGPDIQGDICTHDFAGRTFDVVVICEVLEHLHSPHLAVENLWRALRPGGTIILTVPFVFPIHERPYDYYRYTRYGLEHLFRAFEAVTIIERNSWAEAINVLPARLLQEGRGAARLVGAVLVFWSLLKLPFVLALSRLVRTDFITTGYNMTAKRPADE